MKIELDSSIMEKIGVDEVDDLIDDIKNNAKHSDGFFITASPPLQSRACLGFQMRRKNQVVDVK